MKFKEIPSRLTGLSTPLFGVSWHPTESDVAVARRVLTFLEDRRVLYAELWLEDEEHATRSVIEIRSYLTSELSSRTDTNDDLAQHLRAIRAACRRFLDEEQASLEYEGYIPGRQEDPRKYEPPRPAGHTHDFYTALGRFRAVTGVHIGHLAVKHGIDLEEDLASCLPIPDE